MICKQKSSAPDGTRLRLLCAEALASGPTRRERFRKAGLHAGRVRTPRQARYCRESLKLIRVLGSVAALGLFGLMEIFITKADAGKDDGAYYIWKAGTKDW